MQSDFTIKKESLLFFRKKLKIYWKKESRCTVLHKKYDGFTYAKLTLTECDEIKIVNGKTKSIEIEQKLKRSKTAISVTDKIYTLYKSPQNET